MRKKNHFFESISLKTGLIGLFSVVFCLILGLRCVLLPLEVDNLGGGEANFIYGVQHILAGQNLYSAPLERPFHVIQYSPIFYYNLVAIAKFRGLQAADFWELYVLNRVVCFGYNLLTTFFLYRLLRRNFDIEKGYSYLIAIIFFSTIHPILYARIDSLMLLWNVLLWQTLLAFIAAPRRGTWFLALFFFTLSLLTKQFAVIQLPLLVAAVGLSPQTRGQKFVFGASIFATIAVFSLWLPTQLFGAHYLEHTVFGVSNGISLQWFYGTILIAYFYKIEGFLALIFALPLFLFYYKSNKANLRFLAAAIAFFFVLTPLFALKAGSSAQYFADFQTIMLVATSVFLVETNLEMPKSLAFSVAFFGSFYLLFYTPFFHTFVNKWQEEKADFASQQVVAAYCTQKIPRKTPILIDANCGYLTTALYENAVLPQPDVSYYLLKKGYFDYKQLNAQIVSFVITTKKRGDLPTENLVVAQGLLPLGNYTLWHDFKNGYAIYAADSSSKTQ